MLGSAPAETMQVMTVRSAISMTMKDIQKVKTGNRFNIPTVHGLRKYFNVTLKSRHDANLSLCEKLMGHSVTIQLDNHYGTFSNESIFAEFKKAIPELTISNEERQRITLEAKNKKLSELEEKNKRLDELEKKIEKDSSKDGQLKKLQRDFMLELYRKKEQGVEILSKSEVENMILKIMSEGLDKEN